jgi:sterol desaturase/sphingolipid hydroxylase (fatty acid hydroxylase superfamily)
LPESLHKAALYLIGRAAGVFLSPGSVFSAASLFSALVIAFASLAWTRLRRGKAVKVRAMARALFPRRLLRSPSSWADMGMFLFNTFPAAALIGWAIASASQISRPTAHLLSLAFGGAPLAGAPAGMARLAATLALFLAYEFAYWLDHFLSHKIPAFWEFHKVHHTAEVLTPLTVFRVHPIDSLLFANITAAVMGLVGGVLEYAFGGSAAPFALSGTNIILVAFAFLTVHLQHSHIWISFRGPLGRILMSPAHHQIHHSADPEHFNRNLGSCLSIWDWAFGTLHIPGRNREALIFGAEPAAGAAAPHSVTGMLVTPFAEAAKHLLPAAATPQAPYRRY